MTLYRSSATLTQTDEENMCVIYIIKVYTCGKKLHIQTFYSSELH